MKAYLQFGSGSGPFLTQEVDAKRVDAPRKGQTLTGYGRRIPSGLMVKYESKWRRVYVAQYGNAGTAYIEVDREWVIVQD